MTGTNQDIIGVYRAVIGLVTNHHHHPPLYRLLKVVVGA